MQVIIDEYGESVPIKCLGDFNVQLPRTDICSNNWYKSQGFTVHSRYFMILLVVMTSLS